MSFFRFFSFSPLFMILTFSSIHAAVFEIQNNCSYRVWAAASPGGGRELDQRQSWLINLTGTGRIWARTNCNFDSKGTGICDSGDCGGVHCLSGASPPFTLAEYSLTKNKLDFYDISLVTGFNVPMEFKGTSSGCKAIKCTGDINGLCPTELRHPGGCNNPCTVFKNEQFCCTNYNCAPTAYSKFFKALCPDAFSYPLDDAKSTVTCPTGSDYKVVFCP